MCMSKVMNTHGHVQGGVDEAEQDQTTLGSCATLFGSITCCHTDMASHAHVSCLPPFLVPNRCGYVAILSSSVRHTQVTGN